MSATLVEKIELEFPCEKCGAAPGEWCVAPSGRKTGLHSSRFYQAHAAGKLPLR